MTVGLTSGTPSTHSRCLPSAATNKIEQETHVCAHEETHIDISAVIPVFNSVNSVADTIYRTAAAFEALDLRYEIIAVNDASTDGSWTVLEEVASQNPSVIAINLVKNYGQHPAILCGLVQSRGDFVVTLDDDLQNPPEEIGRLLEKGREGYDLVCGRFRKKRHSLVRRLGSKMIAMMNEEIFGKPKDFALTNFRLMERKLVERICQYRTASPYVSGLAVMHSQRMANVLVEHHERTIGKSSYDAVRLVKFVLNIVFNYSSYPMRVVCAIGLGVSAVSFILGAFVVIKSLLVGSAVQGWTTIVALLSFFNGFLTLMLGMLGEYTIRLMNSHADHRSYHIREIRTALRK
jgi:Glycosyltransferases involved in cell wall biogenesis